MKREEEARSLKQQQHVESRGRHIGVCGEGKKEEGSTHGAFLRCKAGRKIAGHHTYRTYSAAASDNDKKGRRRRGKTRNIAANSICGWGEWRKEEGITDLSASSEKRGGRKGGREGGWPFAWTE